MGKPSTIGWLRWVALLVTVSCGGPSAPPPVNGKVDGVVFVTGATTGAKVTAYSLDHSTGQRGEEIAT
jgi:hypothetical protein